MRTTTTTTTTTTAAAAAAAAAAATTTTTITFHIRIAETPGEKTSPARCHTRRGPLPRRPSSLNPDFPPTDVKTLHIHGVTDNGDITRTGHTTMGFISEGPLP